MVDVLSFFRSKSVSTGKITFLCSSVNGWTYRCLITGSLSMLFSSYMQSFIHSLQVVSAALYAVMLWSSRASMWLLLTSTSRSVSGVVFWTHTRYSPVIDLEYMVRWIGLVHVAGIKFYDCRSTCSSMIPSTDDSRELSRPRMANLSLMENLFMCMLSVTPLVSHGVLSVPTTLLNPPCVLSKFAFSPQIYLFSLIVGCFHHHWKVISSPSYRHIITHVPLYSGPLRTWKVEPRRLLSLRRLLMLQCSCVVSIWIPMTPSTKSWVFHFTALCSLFNPCLSLP